MITKIDCFNMLSDIEESENIDIEEQLIKLDESDNIPLDVIKFIHQHKPIDLFLFYETLRKNYNKKTSPLYKNIVKEITEPKKVLTTLSAMATQILLFADKHEELDYEMFLKHARLDEIYKCLYAYTQTYDIRPCLKLLLACKLDLKALEEISK